MQLYFKQVGSQGGYVLLYDSGAVADAFDAAAAGPAAWPEIKPDFAGAVQTDQLFTVPDYSGQTVVSPFRQPLSNVGCSCQVVLESIYKSRADCIASIRTYAALLQMKVHFKLVEDTETQYYPNACVTRYSPVPSGLACTHAFTFESDTVTNANPDPLT